MLGGIERIIAWTLFGTVTVAKITTVSGLSVWIHKLRKRDVRTHYNM